MNLQSLTTLELDKVLMLLAEQTDTALGREQALTLRPSDDLQEVVLRQRRTAEARHILFAQPRLDLSEARDVRPLVHKAAIGGRLEPSELLGIAGTLRAGRYVRETVGRMEDAAPLLSSVAKGIPDLSPLATDISCCITPNAEVADGASLLLAEVRKHIQRSHDHLMSRLQAFLQSGLGRLSAQEPIITLRDGRYVVPIKADMRGRVKGVVHDVSQSGATVFMEPLQVVELANQWREHQAQEAHEIERILRRLSGLVGSVAEDILAALEALAELDVTLAKARYGNAIQAIELPQDGPEQPWLTDTPNELRLVDARHPLLKGDVVPISLDLGGSYKALLITGPNTGGKTVALKTAGLLALMAQTGLPIPAGRGSRLPAFQAVFADIGDEQSIEQSLSTFSSHMSHIIEVLNNATERSLVLLDELGAGTDPAEGSALAQVILQRLLEKGALTIATTHHGQLKAFAHATPGVMNASVDFDPGTLAPTYRLRIGLPGQSNALAIAERLGMPKAILAQAQEALSSEQVRLGDLLSEIQSERDQTADIRRAEEHARREAEEIRSQLSARLSEVEAERSEMIARARQELEAELSEAKSSLRSARRRLERIQAVRLESVRLAHRPETSSSVEDTAPPATDQSVSVLKQELAAAESSIAAAQDQAQVLQRRGRQRRRSPETVSVRPGDTVWLRDISYPAQALSSPDEQGQMEVQVGIMRMTVPLHSVLRTEASGPSQDMPGLRFERDPGRGMMLSTELDLRGLRADEALARLDVYLDDAFRANLPRVRIIHGHGAGILRQQVRRLLSEHPLVKGFTAAAPREGGEGATVVEMAV